MMGNQGAGQAPLFYAFNLEDHIPADHLLRGIDRFLDLSALRQDLATFYSHTGRPSVDPELMIRMWSSAIALPVLMQRKIEAARRGAERRGRLERACSSCVNRNSVGSAE